MHDLLMLCEEVDNPILNRLSNYKAIAWDFDATLVDGPASELLQYFIKNHPEIEHNILTARSGDYLVNSIFPKLGVYPAKLTRANFKRVITADYEKHIMYQKVRHARKTGKITGPMTPIEYYEYTIKGKVCHDLGIPVLVDDNIKRSEIGCNKYGIILIDPRDCL